MWDQTSPSFTYVRMYFRYTWRKGNFPEGFTMNVIDSYSWRKALPIYSRTRILINKFIKENSWNRIKFWVESKMKADIVRVKESRVCNIPWSRNELYSILGQTINNNLVYHCHKEIDVIFHWIPVRLMEGCSLNKITETSLWFISWSQTCFADAFWTSVNPVVELHLDTSCSLE